ncbi:uncharacterized protein [Halyomorpha halys]|uniref:uncharacterized protein n=1 Tax=Halyomorpha halys TaxID=286706 RepID=UPI0006D4ED4B|nr:uncharacterized protein LOC106679406 [Halyomorpha halys]XP_014274040.1 uncharacterized protein LOC106679406 [Halyomorpha halys]
MEKELLELVLRRHCKASSIDSILDLKVSPGAKDHEGWLSTVTRFTMKVVLKNGRLATKRLIMKFAQCRDKESSEFIKDYNVFKIETMMYKTVLEEMEYLMEEFEDTDGVLWCKLVHHIPYSCLILEDLKASGFDMLDRQSFLDLDSALLAAHSLGRYHGMSKKLEERGLISKDDYKAWFVFEDIEMQKSWLLNINVLIEAVKKDWDSSWEPIVDRIKFKNETFHEKLKKLGEVNESKFNLLNHGDCHKNNIMLKYDWEGKPVALRFIDFQLPHYGSPCCDLTFLLYLGVDPFIRREHYNKLVEVYYASLLRSLERFQYEGKKPTLEEMKEDMEIFSFFGLSLVLFAYPVMFASKDIPLFGVDETEKNSVGTIDPERYTSESFKKKLSPDLNTFVQRFFK